MSQKTQRPGKFIKVHAYWHLIVLTALLRNTKGWICIRIALLKQCMWCRTSNAHLFDQIVSSLLIIVWSLPETFLSVILNFWLWGGASGFSWGLLALQNGREGRRWTHSSQTKPWTLFGLAGCHQEIIQAFYYLSWCNKRLLGFRLENTASRNDLLDRRFSVSYVRLCGTLALRTDFFGLRSLILQDLFWWVH